MADNPAAFPCSPGDVPFWNEGMSLRDWFAGQALAGLCAQSDRQFGIIMDLAKQTGKSITDTRAGVAYLLANAMLVQRKKDAAK